MLEDLKNVMDFAFMNYKGCIIERDNGKYKTYKGLFNTLEEAKANLDLPIKLKPCL